MVPSSTPRGAPPNRHSSDLSTPIRPAPSTQTSSRDPKARSISFDPFLLPLATALKEFISKDHLSITSLAVVKGNTSLHHLLRTLTRAAYEARIGATTADVHKRDSLERTKRLRDELEVLKAENRRSSFELSSE